MIEIGKYPQSPSNPFVNDVEDTCASRQLCDILIASKSRVKYCSDALNAQILKRFNNTGISSKKPGDK